MRRPSLGEQLDEYERTCEVADAMRTAVREERADRDSYAYKLGVAEQEIKRLRAALTEISQGRGPFSRDQLTFATNTIESMKQIALDALAK